MNIHLQDDDKIRVLNGVDLFRVMQRILERSQKIDQKKEHFWVVGLDVTQEILFIELISLGNSSSVQVDPMEVFSFALSKKAYRIVLVHNHPNKSLSPSDADQELTGKMIWAGKFLNVPVWDHLIVTTESYYSFLDSGLMDTLEAKAVNVPDVIKEAVLKRETAEMDMVKTTSRIVINAHRKGMASDLIQELTGFGEEEIKRIIDEFEKGELSD